MSSIAVEQAAGFIKTAFVAAARVHAFVIIVVVFLCTCSCSSLAVAIAVSISAVTLFPFGSEYILSLTFSFQFPVFKIKFPPFLAISSKFQIYFLDFSQTIKKHHKHNHKFTSCR